MRTGGKERNKPEYFTWASLADKESVQEGPSSLSTFTQTFHHRPVRPLSSHLAVSRPPRRETTPQQPLSPRQAQRARVVQHAALPRAHSPSCRPTGRRSARRVTDSAGRLWIRPQAVSGVVLSSSSAALTHPRPSVTVLLSPPRHSGRVSDAFSCCFARPRLRLFQTGIALEHSDLYRATKRARIASASEASTSPSLSAIDCNLFPFFEDSNADNDATMRLHDNGSTPSLNPSPDDTPEAGPSTSNGHTSNGHANGASGSSRGKGKVVAKVALPGSTLYDDSLVDREEFVRLVIQSLRDVGYMCVPFDDSGMQMELTLFVDI